MLKKNDVTIGIEWRFGPDWPGQRCGARTRKGTACLSPAPFSKYQGPRTECQVTVSTDLGFWTEVSIPTHLALMLRS